MTQRIILAGDTQRSHAINQINEADQWSVVTIAPKTRTNEQNAKMWAMLADISRECLINGQKKKADIWKLVFMKSLDYEISFEFDLQGNPFPIGFRSSQLTVKQMADLITFIQAYGDEQGVEWREKKKRGTS